MPTPSDIKKALKEAGLEVYRTRGDTVQLAERVRENLLMDAQVFVRGSAPGASEPPGSEIVVGFIVRAQRSDFPNEGDDRLFERARSIAGTAIGRGYSEVAAELRTILDPGDGERTLDVWCEVTAEKSVPTLAHVVDEARFALTIEKAASAGPATR